MSDKISFVFPAKTEYISAIRLAASGVASSFDFNVDKIEDIKSCIAEACILLMCSQKCESLHILLECGERMQIHVCAVGALKIESCEDCMEFNAEMSKIMIEALALDASFIRKNDVMSEVSFSIAEESEE